MRELLARIKAILRRSAGTGKEEKKDEVVTIGKLDVSFTTYNAFLDGNEVPMSHKEFEVLHYLWEHKNEAVSRDDLLRDVWGQEVYTTTRTIDNFVLKLRQKVELDSNHPKIILTVHGVGYKLVI